MTNLDAFHASEERTFKTVVRALAVAFCVLVTSIAGCVANTNYQKRVLAQTGADPLAVNCLYGLSDRDCLTALAGKGIAQ